jgi:4-amino-4-deoxy-L-arabinose transferase-like glycosyltransferase
MMKQTRPYWVLILILAAIKFILPFILQSPVYELQRDEYLYYQQGQHFDLGYLENPPLLSYLGMISGWLGGSVFWIKFWPCLFGSFTVIVACLIAAEFSGKIFAQFLAGMGIMSGAFLRMHSLFQPNVLDIFFWTLAAYFLIRFIKTENKKFFYACAVAFALGIWSKYSIVFFIAAVGLSLLLTSHRKNFKDPFVYKSVLLAVLIVLPNIWWQWQHKWPLIHHMQELQETQLQFLNPLDFIKDQLLYLLPFLFIWITGLIWLLRNKQWRFLFLTYFLVIIFLLLGRGKSYYSMGIYPVLLAAGAVAWEKITFKKQWLRWGVIIFIAILTIPFIPILLPIWKPEKLATFYKKYQIEKIGILRWEDQQNHPLPQDFADMLGWKELTQKTEKFFNTLPTATQADVVIYCRHYGQAGSLKFYGKESYFTQKVFSDNGSFLLWISNRLWFKHLIFIGRRMPGSDDEVFQHFNSVRIVDSVTNLYSRQYGDKIIFFQNIDSAGLKLAREGLKEMKREFQR